MKPTGEEKPEEVMQRVTTEMIVRAIRLGQRNKRTIRICKSSSGEGVPVDSLDPSTSEGKVNLARFFIPIKRQYTFCGLGSQEEKGSVNWRSLNMPLWRRVVLTLSIAISLFLRGTPIKNHFLRKLGVKIGKGAEIMQFVWLDHFRPELIFIGENTLVGAMTRFSVHAYEGNGKFRYGLIEIGKNCTLAAGTGMGPIIIKDNVRTLPGTTLSPYFVRIKEGSIVGWSKPDVRMSDDDGLQAKQ